MSTDWSFEQLNSTNHKFSSKCLLVFVWAQFHMKLPLHDKTDQTSLQMNTQTCTRTSKFNNPFSYALSAPKPCRGIFVHAGKLQARCRHCGTILFVARLQGQIFHAPKRPVQREPGIMVFNSVYAR